MISTLLYYLQGNVNVPEYPLAGSIAWLYADAVIHLIIAWYLDNVLPGEFGVKLPFWFVFSPKYWRHIFCSQNSATSSTAASVQTSTLAKNATDPIAHAATATDHTAHAATTTDHTAHAATATDHTAQAAIAAVEVSGLVKMFRKNPLYESVHDKLAVNGVSFSIAEGQVFSFLGHNGAGKTTTINLLCGMYDVDGFAS
jgi:ABC-type multidrug transport system fused ATPase/permease subunit